MQNVLAPDKRIRPSLNEMMNSVDFPTADMLCFMSEQLGKTPLCRAKGSGKDAAVLLLQSRDAFVNAVDKVRLNS